MKKFYIEPEFDCLLLTSLEDFLTGSDEKSDVTLDGSGNEFNDGDSGKVEEDWNDDENWE